MAFTTVCVPHFSADGGRLLIHSLVNGFHDGLCAVLLSGWQWIARTFTRQRLSQRIAYRIAPWMAVDCLNFRSSMAFTTDCVPYCSADGSRLLIPPLVNHLHDGLDAVWLRLWQWVAPTSACQWLSRRFAPRIAQWMVADCSFFRSSMAFPTVCAPYCTVNGSRFFLLPVVNRFHDGSHAVLLSAWQRIADISTRQCLSRRFVRRIAQRMAADCTFFLSSTAFTTVCAPYCSADGSPLLILPLVNSFSDGLRTVLLSGCQRIAYTSTR